MSNLALLRFSLLCATSASLRYPFSFCSLFLPEPESVKLK
jgi:hypothetical protein